jgi:hypothetical protein
MKDSFCIIDNNSIRLDSAKRALKDLKIKAICYADVHPNDSGAPERNRTDDCCKARCPKTFVCSVTTPPLFFILHVSNPCRLSIIEKFAKVPFLMVSGDAKGAGERSLIKETFGINCTTYQRAWEPERYSKASWLAFVRGIEPVKNSACDLSDKLNVIEIASRSFGMDEILSAATQELYWRSLPFRIANKIGDNQIPEFFWLPKKTFLFPEGKTFIAAALALLNKKIRIGDLVISIKEISTAIGASGLDDGRTDLLRRMASLKKGMDVNNLLQWSIDAERYLKALRNLFISFR